MYLSLNQFNSIDGANKQKKKATHRWHYWWASCILVLCPSGTNTFETIRNRRLICSEETPASLREVNGSFGDQTMILISLVFWASFSCDWQSHKSIQERFGRAKLEIFFFSYRLVLPFLQSSSVKQIRVLLIQQMSKMKLCF